MPDWRDAVFARIWWEDWLMMWREIGWTHYFGHVYNGD